MTCHEEKSKPHLDIKRSVPKCNEKRITWFRLYLQNRKQSVHIDGCTSTILSIRHGVPTRILWCPYKDLLGPLLLILFTNDLPLFLITCFIYLCDRNGHG